MENPAARNTDGRARVNVLFLNSSKRWGGTEQWISLAAASLSQKTEVHLACRNPALWRGSPVRRFRLPFLFEADPVTIFHLVRLIRKHRIRALVPTKRKDYALAGIASRLTGVRNVLRLGIVRRLEDGWTSRLIYGTWADGIVVNAEKIRSVLSESPFVRMESVRVIYNGVDAEAIARKSEESFPPVPEFPFTVLSMGELSGRKGTDALIRGFADFHGRVPGVKAGLFLVGDGPDRLALERLAGELGIGKAVVFTGFQRNPYPILRRCDLFVMASRNEGLSNALLEAMALGKPAAVTSAGGTEELIRNGENGIVIGDDSPESIGEALADLHRDRRKRNRIAENGRRTALERCSTDRMRDELLDFIGKVVSGIERKP